MVARRTADCKSLAVITSYSSQSDQKSCCVTALSSSTIKTLGFTLILSLLVANVLQCSYRTSRATQEERGSFEKLRSGPFRQRQARANSLADCLQCLTELIVECVQLWTDLDSGRFKDVWISLSRLRMVFFNSIRLN